MNNDMTQLELIKELQLGNSESMDKLYELVESRVTTIHSSACAG